MPYQKGYGSRVEASPDIKPWHKLPAESEGDYLRFKVWLMNGWAQGERPKARDTNATAKFLGVTRGVISATSGRHNWTKRGSAYDSHLMAQHATGALADLADMRARQNKLLNDGLSVLESTLERLKGTLAGDDREALKAVKVDVPRLMDTVLKYQNLLYGQATENVAAKVEFGEEWDLSALSIEELRTFNALRAKVQRRAV